MALIKYVGSQDKTIILNGSKKLLSTGQIFSGPSHLVKYDEFQVLGTSKRDKEERPIEFSISGFVENQVDLDFLDESGRPKVSICIVTKDGCDLITRCIGSIQEHVEYSDYEVVICDTGTTDERVLDFYKTLDPLKYTVFLGHEYNFSKNNNFMAKNCSGEALLFMNNDVFLTYDAVSEMVKYANCSNIGCVGHRLVWDENRNLLQHDGQLVYDKRSGAWIGPGHHNYKMDMNSVSSDNLIVEGVTAAFLMVRKKYFDKVGGFDENYKDIFQDVDLNLKINDLGLSNFVIRERALLHVDHGSRKSDSTAESPADLQRFMNNWIRKGPRKIRKSVKYSILICATKKHQMQKYLDSIKSREPYEFIFVNNTKNYMYSAEALNVLTEVSTGEILLYTHQDVYFKSPEPFSRIDKIIGKLGNNFGIIGPAGVQYNGGHNMKGVDFSSKDYTFDAMKVHTIDEFCLITKRSNNLEFGEYLDHFHFYGADICLSAVDKGLRNYVVALDMVHDSGGDGNLKAGDGYDRYREQARKLYTNWGKKYPMIGTTTARFSNGYLYYFLGHSLGLFPVDEIMEIDESTGQYHYKVKTAKEEVPKDRWL
jgi:GT2 family glycosyltransferase